MEHYSRVIIFSNFIEIARQNWQDAQAYQTELHTLTNKDSEINTDDDLAYHKYQVSTLQNQIDNKCIIVIIFSALALEGYIYDYGARNLEDKFVETHLDKLDVVSKWVIIPKMVTGKDFPKSGRGFQLLKRLITERNFLVHNKSSSFFTFDQNSKSFVLSGGAKRLQEFNEFESAKSAINTLDELAIIMENLDQNEYTSHLFGSMVGHKKRQFDQYGV